MIPFCDKLKHIAKSLKVKIFLNFFGTFKEVPQVADIPTTNHALVCFNYVLIRLHGSHKYLFCLRDAFLLKKSAPDDWLCPPCTGNLRAS